MSFFIKCTIHPNKCIDDTSKRVYDKNIEPDAGGMCMNPYIKKLQEQLSQMIFDCGEQNINSVLEMLYCYYREQRTTDTEVISADFNRLDSVLSKLTLKEYDQVWDLTCALCSEHEKAAFLEGVRVGASLAAELAEDCV